MGTRRVYSCISGASSICVTRVVQVCIKDAKGPSLVYLIKKKKKKLKKIMFKKWSPIDTYVIAVNESCVLIRDTAYDDASMRICRKYSIIIIIHLIIEQGAMTYLRCLTAEFFVFKLIELTRVITLICAISYERTGEEVVLFECVFRFTNFQAARIKNNAE